MIPDSEALDQLHAHLRNWQQGYGSLTDDDINSSGGADDATVDLASLRRGRAMKAPAKPSVDAANPVYGGQPGDMDPQPPTAAAGPSSSPRGAMMSAAMGASTPLGYSAPPQDAELAALQNKAADEKRMGDVGKAVTAFTERPTHQLDAIQQLGGVKPSAMQHNPTWDNSGAEGEQAIKDLQARRASGSEMEKNNPRSSTADTYRAVLTKFSPDLAAKLANATPAQMEKIAPWLEAYAKDQTEAGKNKSKGNDAAELDSFKRVMAQRYPQHAAEIAALTTMKGAQDFQNAYEGDKTRASNESIAAGVRATAREEKTSDAERARAAVESDKDQAAAQHLAGKAAESNAAAKALDDIDAVIAENPNDIPGVGRWKSRMPDFVQGAVLSDKGLNVRNNARDVLGVLLHKRSGAAVSPAELARYEQMFGLNGDEKQFIAGVARMRRDFAAELAAEQAGVSPGAKTKFREAGGMSAEDIAPNNRKPSDSREHKTLSNGVRISKAPGGQWEADE